MIPPISPSILESNPQFASLYKHLTANLLNPDASTRAICEAQAPVSEARRPHLIRAAKEELLRCRLRNLFAASEDREDKDVLAVPPELRELILTISMLLDEESNTSLDQDDYDLLRPEIDTFHDEVEIIAAAVSKDLQRQHEILCKIASASQLQTLPSWKTAANSKRKMKCSDYLSSPSLPSLLSPLLPAVPSREMQSSFASLAATTSAHTNLHRHLLSTTITHSERVIHGLQTRHLKARSAHLSVAAMGLAKRIQVLYLTGRRDIYRPDVQHAIEIYARYLEGLKQQLEDTERICQEELVFYENVGLEEGGKGQRWIMKEVGRRYGELLQAVEDVKGEIQKLEGGEKCEKRGGTG
jgi:hypothetical protein